MLTGSISWTVARTGTVHIVCPVPFAVCSLLLTLGSTPKRLLTPSGGLPIDSND